MRTLLIIAAGYCTGSAFTRIYMANKWERDTARWLAKRFGRSGPDGADVYAAEEFRKRSVVVYLVLAVIFAVAAWSA